MGSGMGCGCGCGCSADVISNARHAYAQCAMCVCLDMPSPRMGMRPAIRTPDPFCVSNLQMRIEHRYRQTPGPGGPAWQTANGTYAWPIETGHGNPEHARVCLFELPPMPRGCIEAARCGMPRMMLVCICIWHRQIKPSRFGGSSP